ncbi:MAG: peroxiredoxin [Candidatus Heimdallarchaeota archaeon]|nr:peroxiredoxin [Candidatus Heimdallarchaeota archaeon]
MNSSLLSAPDFSLEGTKNLVSLAKLKGSPTILVFYPEDGTPVCTSQLSLYNEILPMFEKHGSDIYGISVDSRKSQKKFQASLGLKFDLLSDTDPRGAVSKNFGVYDEKKKQSKRAIFVLNGDGDIHWSQIFPGNVNPGADGILKALEEISRLSIDGLTQES